jgi:hypothetical protein
MLDDLREQIGAWLAEEPGLPAIAVLERKKTLHPDRLSDKHARTVQRAVKRWRAEQAHRRYGRRLRATAARPRGSTGTPRASLRLPLERRCATRGSPLWTSGTTRSAGDTANPGNIRR